MLYAVIMHFDSLREIEASMLAEVWKFDHIGLKTVPRQSTLSDAKDGQKSSLRVSTGTSMSGTKQPFLRTAEKTR